MRYDKSDNAVKLKQICAARALGAHQYFEDSSNGDQ